MKAGKVDAYVTCGSPYALWMKSLHDRERYEASIKHQATDIQTKARTRSEANKRAHFMELWRVVLEWKLPKMKQSPWCGVLGEAVTGSCANTLPGCKVHLH
eukprot:1157523-Pelagomonas_calceolata.AAC.10